MKAIRDSYAQALVELAPQYDFYVMDADLAKATKTITFQNACPDRFVDMGIAEANMYGYAAGISVCGTPVFASTFSSFAAGRAYDQIRNSIAYPHNHVIIAATHGGVLIGADGGSHQCVEDIALMRAIPQMTVLCPCDDAETRACVKAALLHREGPVYLRLGRSEVPELFGGELSFEIGKGDVLRDGRDVTIIAVGEMVHRAAQAAELLSQQGVDAAVVSMASIKPIDRALIAAYARKTGHIVTAEDHNVQGGLGGAVSEVLAQCCPVPMEMVGVQDCFGCSGDPEELAKRYGLDPQAIVDSVRRVLQR
ncbi:MAG: transketolase family protein [Lawsonibacter sp.]